MEKSLYNRKGEAVAYVANDFHDTIYLWEGQPVAYIYEEEKVYGFNGRHLGWFRNEVLFTHGGERIGFDYTTCPAPVIKPPVKGKKAPPDEMRPRWGAPSLPKFGYSMAQEDLAEFLRSGAAVRYPREKSPDGSSSPSQPSPS